VGHQPALPRAAAAPPVNEQPTRRAILADITCDSDGKIDRFIDLRDVKRTLELHPLRPNEPYYLGFFLVGAYQEILGDMHNLFGDPNIVHVDLDENGRPRITHVVRGDRTEEVLSYVEYFEQDVLARLRRHIERSLEEGRMTFEESALLQRAATRPGGTAELHLPLRAEAGATGRGVPLVVRRARPAALPRLARAR
jgi:arginine decarboxylase-like protein